MVQFYESQIASIKIICEIEWVDAVAKVIKNEWKKVHMLLMPNSIYKPIDIAIYSAICF